MVARGFPTCLLAFTIIYALLTIAIMGLLCSLIVSFVQDLHCECDVPLHIWVAVDLGSTAYHAIHGTVLQVCFSRDQDPLRPLRWHERLHLVVVAIFDFTWLGLGLYWLWSSKTCAQTASRLYKAAEIYAIASTVGNVFMCINMIGLYTIMCILMQNGVLRTKEGAPSGTLEKLQVVAFDEDAKLFKDNPECSICLAVFSKNSEVRQCHCAHIFHGRCLGNWLKVNRTCPLCRSDVTSTGTPLTGSAVVSETIGNSRSFQNERAAGGHHYPTH